MIIINVLLGFVMLIMGRQFFWVLISGLGFIIGMSYAHQFIPGPPGVILLVSLGLGAIGAILAYILQHAAAGLAGFISGWYLSTAVMGSIPFNLGEFQAFLPILGGIIGTVFIIITMEWSLIILSTTTGAYLVSQSILLSQPIKNAIFLVLLLLGLIIQSILYLQEQNDFSR